MPTLPKLALQLLLSFLAINPVTISNSDTSIIPLSISQYQSKRAVLAGYCAIYIYIYIIIVCTPHPCSSSCIITVLYCIVIQYYYLHYAFHLSHSLIGDIMSSFRTKLCCSIFKYFCVIIQNLYNDG